MPKIPAAVLRSTFYLYPSAEDAHRGANLGGTGFFVGVPSELTTGRAHAIAVSNWHVVCAAGCSVVRINKLDGGVDVCDIQPDQWHFSPGEYDIAVIRLPVDDSVHDFTAVSTELLISESDIGKFEIGPGENVFMAGRFIDHDGGGTNKPALRFGHISMMPEMIKQLNGSRQRTYCVDVHSRTGFSGSPVFSYRTVAQDLSRLGDIDNTDAGRLFFGLLGVHCSQFPEDWTVSDRILVPHEGAKNLMFDGQVIKGLSGMTCVAPAWAIKRTIEMTGILREIEVREKLVSMRRALRQEIPDPKSP